MLLALRSKLLLGVQSHYILYAVLSTCAAAAMGYSRKRSWQLLWARDRSGEDGRRPDSRDRR